MRTEEWQEKAAFIDKLRELTDHLNRCRAAYEAHTPLVSDEVYDILFSDLQTPNGTDTAITIIRRMLNAIGR